MSQPKFSYPDDFIRRVMAEFPNDAQLSTLLEKGSKYAIGHKLEENNKFALLKEWHAILKGKPPKEIINLSPI